ncbi:NAD-dependent epimerase/dehydratase family protein [Bradyrhizobium sp.]|uniref:NAD-dependent epimerase/dehydratase family protein n=1 Tax=Bradyrhizobium sp. TaxID=376 RepID=UPI003C4E0BB6
MKNVLVTGSGGLLGAYVVRELRDRYAVSGFDVKRGSEDIPTTEANLLDVAAVRRAVAGQDAILHIAARANIWSGTGADIMSVNVTGTWNVLEAAEAAGVERVVLCSSDSVIGFTVMSSGLMAPLYVPIDQAHPLRPTDPYALSKQCVEAIGRGFAARGKLAVMALRPVFILYPEMYDEVRARAKDPAAYAKHDGPMVGGPSAAGGGPAWHYVDPRDVARAFRLALDRTDRGFASFFLAGRTTLAPEPTIERFEKRIGRTIELRKPDIHREQPFAPLYDLAETKAGLGWEAEHDLRSLFVA